MLYNSEVAGEKLEFNLHKCLILKSAVPAASETTLGPGPSLEFNAEIEGRDST